MKNQTPLKAFSLVELGVVILIIGVVTLVALNGKSLLKKADCVKRNLSSDKITNLTADNVGSNLKDVGSSAYEDCVNKGSSVSTSGPASCKAILTSNPSSVSGFYTIDPTGTSPFKVYCDMTNSGGGWTLIVAQYEDYPVNDWNQGVVDASFIAPTAAMLDNCGNSTSSANGCDQVNSAGFVLNSSQIPTHTQTAFGKGSNATFIGYSNFVYTNGNINKTLLTNLKDSNNYHIHRSDSEFYDFFDPELTLRTKSPGYYDILTYDKSGSAYRSWSFNPNFTVPEGRGYGMDGALAGSQEPYAWTVWVR